MKNQLQDHEACTVAATVAPEDLRRGDYIAVLSEIVECPSFLWNDAMFGGASELVRLRRLPTENREPLKIKAICLPFVFVKSPAGQFQTIDVRLASLVRLENSYAKTVWRSLRTPAPRPSFNC